MAGIPFVLDLATFNAWNGVRITGSTYYEVAGSSVASAGDINGDGFADVIVGAPGAALSLYTDYAATVVFGRGIEDTPADSVIDTGSLNSSEGFRIILGGGYNGPEGGFAVSSAGDFNGDGFDDLMVSAPSSSSVGAAEKGATYIVFGKAGGFTDVTLGAATSSNWIRIDGAAADDYSGRSVAALGDINGDGYGDVLIGAPGSDANGWSSGVSYVVYGNASGANIDLANFDATDGFRIIGEEYGSAGQSVSAAGDVNGDGHIDYIIGAPYNDVNGLHFVGSTYVVFGGNGGVDIDLANLTPSQGIRIDGDGEGQNESGYSVASAGDINGDGLADLIIGAPEADPDGREGAGSAYVIFGKTSGWSNIDLANLAAGDGFRIDGAAAGDNAAYSVSSAGDFNGDGYDDLIIGAPNANDRAGSAYVIFGKASGFGDIDLTNFSAADGFRIDGVAGHLVGGQAGYAVASAGDVDGDGYSDLVVGAPGSGVLNGSAYVIHGEASAAVNKTGTSGDDRLFGGDFDDTLSGGDGNDLIGGKDGNDVLTGGAGRDAFVYVHAGEQHDTVTDFQQGEDVIDLRSANIGTFAALQQLLSNDADGNAVITTIRDGLASRITLTGVSADQLTAADFVFASDADSQVLDGTANADDLFGGAGGDILRSGAGDDRLFGEQGNDSLEGGAGADRLDGGDGIDTAEFRAAQTGVVASLTSGGSAGDAAGDTYISIEDMWGSEFNDVLEGNDQANSIWGLGGDNTIRGLGGNDRLTGGSGNDTFYGGAGADEINGGGGFDYARYDDATSGVIVRIGSGGGDGAGDILTSIEGIVGSAFADQLGGSGVADDLQGGGGDDLLQGRGGDDTLDGGEGSDRAVYTGSRSNYVITFDAATGTYIVRDLREGAPDGTDRVRNVETFVFADGAIAAAAVLDGNPGPVAGDDGDNVLTGTAIGEEISGLGGNDTLSGLGGEDVLDGGAGDDMLDGGTGLDTATYASAGQGVTVSLAVAGAQATGGAGTDTLVAIENLTGSDFDDTLTGNAGANVLKGLAGNDILTGGAGADVLDGGEGFDLVSYESATAGLYIDLAEHTFTGDGFSDTFVSIEGVIGSNFRDQIVGSSADEFLIGGGGNDVIFASGGTDTVSGGVGDDVFFDMGSIGHFDGGAGDDILAYLAVPVELIIDPETFDYVIIGEGITADLADPSRNTGFAAGDTYTGIETLIGSYADDELAGDEQDNTLRGSLGNDVIWGCGGNDLLEGDLGDDRLIGGAGADVLFGNIDFLGYMEFIGRIIGPIADDIIDQARDIVDDPEFEAGDGIDIASYETATSGVVASLTDSTVNTGDAAGDTYILIEGLAGSAFDDTLIGTAGWDAHNILEGGAGNDTLIGLGGGDDYDGGTGNDTAVFDENRAAYTITYDAATQTYTLTSAWGVNHVTAVETLQFADGTLSVASLFGGSNNDDSLTGTVGQDDLNGGGGNDSLYGLAGNDRLDGGAGDDLLGGGVGDDTLIGGIGRDAASYGDATAAVSVDLRVSGAQATGGGGTDTLTGIEDLVGSAFGDTLIGTTGDNALRGGSGNDMLIGLGGNDIFDGGDGIDTVSYEGARSFATTIDLALTGPQAIGGSEGFATLINVENAIASSYWGGTLKGNSAANHLTGGINASTLMGRGGDDVLDGTLGRADTASYAESANGVTVDLTIGGPQNTGEGADTLIAIENLTGSAFADTLKGSSGDNVLIGGAGDDMLIGRGGANRLDGGDGFDTVSYEDAAAGVRVDLSVNGGQYTGVSSDTLINVERVVGSAFADTLIGNAGANALSGGGGIDVLTGGLGRDTLTGGADRDVFDFNTLAESAVGAGNRDVITDFQSGMDDIDLTGIDASTDRSGDQGFRFIGAKDFTGKAGELSYQTVDQAGTTNDITVVRGDVNGDRVADFEIEIRGIVQLSSGDFLL